MITIYKYVLSLEDEQLVEMPRAAEVLHVHKETKYTSLGDHEDFDAIDYLPAIWCRVNTDAPLVQRRIIVRGTGHECPGANDYVDNPPPKNIGGTWSYVGTAHCPPFVWHVFDGGEVDA